MGVAALKLPGVVNKSGRDRKIFPARLARGLFSTLLDEILDTPLKRVLSLHWNQSSYETMKYLRPNKIDCTLTKVKACMTIMNLIMNLEGLRQWTLLKNLNYCTSNLAHVTVDHELQVPFLRGMFKAIRTNTGMNTALKIKD